MPNIHIHINNNESREDQNSSVMLFYVLPTRCPVEVLGLKKIVLLYPYIKPMGINQETIEKTSNEL